MAKQQYRYFSSLFFAWFSTKLYRDVAQRWQGGANGYLLLLSFIAWLPISIMVIYASLFISSNDYFHELINKAPHVVFKDGKLKLNRASPYIVNDLSGTRIVCFDLQASPQDVYKLQCATLFTKTEFVIAGTRKPGVIPLDIFGDFDLTRDKLIDLISMFMYSLAIYGMPLLILMGFMWRWLFAKVFAGLGWLIAKLLRRPLNYKVCTRLTVVAMTPGTLFLALGLNAVLITLTAIITLGLTLLYLIFAVWSQDKAPRTKRSA